MGEKKGKNTVFYVSLIIVGIIAVWSVAFNDSFTVVANAAFKVLTTDFAEHGAELPQVFPQERVRLPIPDRNTVI